MISIVLVKPKTAGNIGAIARVMKNFDFRSLVLVEPRCNHLSKDALDRASNAKDILKKARIMSFEDVIERYDYVIATTSKIGTDYNIPRCPLTPEELAGKVSGIKGRAKIAILLGNESSGLTNKEIHKCDFVVCAPTSKKYPALNISHACAIILYSIYAKKGRNKTIKGIWPITNKEKKQIDIMITKILNNMQFETEERRDTQRKLWKRIVGKSMMTRRESYAMMGFLKKIIERRI